jgi:hypothetical protein
VEKESKKHHPEARLWVRDDLGARIGDHRGVHQESFLFGLSQIYIRNGGCGPANGLFLGRFLHHLTVMCNALGGHAMVTRSELKGENGRKDEEEKVVVEEQRSRK